MKAHKLLVMALALSWAAGISAGPSFGQSAKSPAAEKEKKSLIRMDLLRVQKSGMGVPERNIFSPQSSSRLPVQPNFEGPQRPQPGLQAQEQSVTQEETPQAPPQLSINLRYIGFIKYAGSSKKITALIILEGKAVAVREGEVVGEGVRIGKITPNELEVIMPDSTTKKFSLEREGE